ncbi:MAG: hypothetical protein IJ583_05550 [Firmicutes bacterium]|nr:hypothetical protein [Bacillota bacterium]
MKGENELKMLIEELKKCSEVLMGISDGLKNLSCKSEEKTKKKKATDNKALEEETTTPAKAESKSITLEEVRAVLAEKAREGFTDEIKALITKHGAERLSDIEPSKFEGIIAEAEGIGNA